MRVPRRAVLKGMAGLPLAAVLADPLVARAVAAALETVTATTAAGRTVTAALALPARTPAPAVLLVHEWWGLNDQIKSVAAELARQGFVALAVDLYEGAVTDNPGEARRLARRVMADPAAASDTLAAWVAWLRRDGRTTGRLATIGWCFGGGWALNAALVAPVDAVVVYYGNVARTAKDLARLEGPVLGHFATRDRWINRSMVARFEDEMRKAGKSLTAYWYEADHAFANPTRARYDAEDAALAWTRTLSFLRKVLF